MIDFHTHVLPGIDDGSTDIRTSLAMLRDSAAGGIDTVVCSSHCYPKTEDDIYRYIERRDRAFSELEAAIAAQDEQYPAIVPGCELNMLTDVSACPDLYRLAIGDTKFIMVEMPFNRWDDWMYESLYSMMVRGLRPVMAHIDRYMAFKDKFQNLYDLDVLYQINTEAFLTTSARKFCAGLITGGHGHILGSDMHNTTTRATTYAKAISVIGKKLGHEYVEYFNENASCVISNKHVHRTAYKQLPKLKLGFKLFG